MSTPGQSGAEKLHLRNNNPRRAAPDWVRIWIVGTAPIRPAHPIRGGAAIIVCG